MNSVRGRPLSGLRVNIQVVQHIVYKRWAVGSRVKSCV